MPPNSKADYAFLAHILHHLKDDGVAVTLNFPGILYRGAREKKIRKWLIENNYIDKVVSVPPKMFEDTAIATVILVLKKNKTSTDVLFEDIELEMQRLVTLEEIKNEDFNLNTNLYVWKEEEKEEIDPLLLNEEIRNNTKLVLKQELARDLIVNKLDENLKNDTSKYCEDLIFLIKEFKEKEIKNDNYK